MEYSVFSSAGNLIDAFDEEGDARAALQRIVEAEPDAADDVAIFISNDDGTIIEGPIHGTAAPDR